MTEKQQTTQEKRLARIAQLEAQLQKERSRLNAEKRKERNGQLIAFGLWVEEYLKRYPEQIESIKHYMEDILEDKILERALNGLKRIYKEKLK